MKNIFFTGNLLILILNSCSSDSSESKNNTNQKHENSSEDSLENTPVTNSSIPETNHQKGLSDKVLGWYIEKYKNDSLETVVNGFNGVKFDPKAHKVYFDTTLHEMADLRFFKIKYEEFLESESKDKPINAADTIIKENYALHSNLFSALSAREFISNKTKYKDGDVHFTFYKPFYHDKSYYVHGLILHQGTTSFHYRFCTFKFNLSKEFVQLTCENYFQYDYAGFKTFYKEFKL